MIIKDVKLSDKIQLDSLIEEVESNLENRLFWLLIRLIKVRLKCLVIHISFQDSCYARILSFWGSGLRTCITSFAITLLEF